MMHKTIPTFYFVIAISVVVIILGVIFYRQVIYKPETPLMTDMYSRTAPQKSK
jgi:hypothetical protein